MFWGIAIGILVLVCWFAHRLGQFAADVDRRHQIMIEQQHERDCLNALYHCEMSEKEREELERTRWY